jgi:putative addiction module antidote
MVELKVRRFGNSLGVVLPREVVQRLRTDDGEPIFLIEVDEREYRLTPRDPGFDRKMAKASELMARYPNALRALAKVKRY